MNDKSPWRHHASMLKDKTRIEKFYAALERSISDSDCVVDIGTGTGILASYASSLTSGNVTGIEFFPQLANLARSLTQEKSINIIEGRSFDVQLDVPPNVLVTETIGLIGPEENIVEICADFKYRHPTLRTILPTTLSIWAEPVYSLKIDADYNRIIEAISLASTNESLPHDWYSKMEMDLAHELRTGDLDDAKPCGRASNLVKYVLGLSKTSDFRTFFNLDDSTSSEANGVHLYFEADLLGDILSSHRNAPHTHWRNAWIRRPHKCNSLEIKYESKSRKFSFRWR
jgi:predicted RNA methylase